MLDLNAGNAAEAARYYSEHADALLDRYEQVAFEAVHTELLKHLPIQSGSALDVGAGSGRDAAWLARHGWSVVAAEPSKPLREGGGRLHQNAKIQWIDDALPELNAVHLLNRKFDLILLSAVWMHVPPASEETALAATAELAAPGGIISISVRMGGDEGKRGFYTTDVGRLKVAAARMGFTAVAESRSSDRLGRPAVGWKNIIFRH